MAKRHSSKRGELKPRKPIPPKLMNRLSRNPQKRIDQLRWHERGVNPLSASDFLAYADSAKNKAGRSLAVNALLEFQLVKPAHVPRICRYLWTDRSPDVQGTCTWVAGHALGRRAEPFLIKVLESTHVTYKYTAALLLKDRATKRCVPVLASLVRSWSKKRAGMAMGDTERSLGVIILSRFAKTHEAARVALEDIDKRWANLSPDEAESILRESAWMRRVRSSRSKR